MTKCMSETLIEQPCILRRLQYLKNLKIVPHAKSDTAYSTNNQPRTCLKRKNELGSFALTSKSPHDLKKVSFKTTSLTKVYMPFTKRY